MTSCLSNTFQIIFYVLTELKFSEQTFKINLNPVFIACFYGGKSSARSLLPAHSVKINFKISISKTYIIYGK